MCVHTCANFHLSKKNLTSYRIYPAGRPNFYRVKVYALSMDALAVIILIVLVVSLGAFIGIAFEKKQQQKAIDGIKNEV